MKMKILATFVAAMLVATPLVAQTADLSATVFHSNPSGWIIDFPWQVLGSDSAVVVEDTSATSTFGFTMPLDTIIQSYNICVKIRRITPATNPSARKCKSFDVGPSAPMPPDSIDVTILTQNIQALTQRYITGDTTMRVSYSLAYLPPAANEWYELWVDGEMVSTTAIAEMDMSDWQANDLDCREPGVWRCAGLPWDCGNLNVLTVACPTGTETFPYSHLSASLDNRVAHESVARRVDDSGVIAERTDYWASL